MGTVRKPENGATREEILMAKYRKENRVHTEMIGVKAIDPKKGFQAREEALDPDHVRRLQGMMRSGVDLFPIVVFHDPDTKEWLLADGFHRLDAYRREGRPNVPAEVVIGSSREAIEYAACCNQLAIKTRTKGDTKKAAFMLFSLDDWWAKCNAAIASHVGCSGGAIASYRTEYSKEKGIRIPAFTKTKSGVRRPYRNPSPNQGGLVRDGWKKGDRDAGGYFYVKASGSRINLGPDKAAAEAKFEEIQKAKADLRSTLKSAAQFRMFLSKRGIRADSLLIGATWSKYSASCTRSFLIATVTEISQAALDHAVASISIFRHRAGPELTPVIAWEGIGVSDDVIEALADHGITLLTPDELVDRILKGDSRR